MLNSQLEILEQGQNYLKLVSKPVYTAIISPNFMSCSGSHMRHIIDHYLAIISGFPAGIINYDLRLRGDPIEDHPELAMKKLTEISQWLQQLSEQDINKTLLLSTEVSIINKKVQTVQTTLARELVFAASHAVHHYAMIGQISCAQNILLDPTFGLAPATATFLRQQNSFNKNTAQLAAQN